MRLLAVDYGLKRIGLALSDITASFVARTLTIARASNQAAAQEIASLAKTEEVGKIILGYPLNVDGSRGEMTARVENFRMLLEKKTKLPVVLADERYTSEEAHKYLHLHGGKVRGRKNKIDALSAAVILDDYLRESGNA